MRRLIWLVVMSGCAATSSDRSDGGVAGKPDAAPCTAGGLGQDCTSGQGICERAGKTFCRDGHIECDAIPGDPGVEICDNGLDDDCDGLVDEGFSQVGMPCTSGLGACARMGTYICSKDGTRLECDAVPGEPGPQELCGNGIDDDCNGMTDEGFDDLGRGCDGPDRDLCPEGVWVCSDDLTSLVCDDRTDDTLDVCNGLDDDCDPSTPDGSQDPMLGQPCDGPDADTCNEGVYVGCRDGKLVCSDDTTNDTTNDPKNCGACGAGCENPHGTTDCVASTCVPTCETGFQACGDPRAGCTSHRDTGPTCPGPMLGTVAGDSGANVLTATGYGEADYLVRVSETDLSNLVYLSAGVGVQSPPGVGFQVCAACFDCQSQRRVCAYNGPGGYAEVRLARDDDQGDQSFIMSIEVIFMEGDSTSCDDFDLTVGGNVVTDDRTCN